MRRNCTTVDIQERIIAEAGALFARYGIRSITMDFLAEQMGISKRTIYENFSDKETLLKEIILRFKKQQVREAQQIITDSENIIEAMFTLLQRMVNTMKNVNPLFFQDIKRYHAGLFRQMQEKGDLRDHSVTGNILDEGVRQGILRSDLNRELVNLAIHELFNMFRPDSTLTSVGYDRAEMFDNIVIPYLIGISTEEGRQLIEKHRGMETGASKPMQKENRID